MFYWKNKNSKRTINNAAVRTIYIVLISAICFTSCKQQEEKKISYYPLDSLINSQVVYLRDTKATLIKHASLDQKTDTTSYIPDSAAWSNELGILAQLGMINKPIYKGLYRVHDGLPDPKSNLKIRYYEGKKDMPVPFLKIYYQETLDHVRKIEGEYNEENSLYSSSHVLSIELQDIHNKTVLTSYSIKGSQKMVLADSIEFNIDARISVN